jgi:hypothetical protein
VKSLLEYPRVTVVDILHVTNILLLAGKLNLVCIMLQFLGQSYCYYMQISSVKEERAEIFYLQMIEMCWLPKKMKFP